MLPSRILPLLHHESPLLLSRISSNLHTSKFLNRRKEKRDKSCEAPSVAIILCGCGNLDGTEISEAMSATFHICQKEMKPRFFAPDIEICGSVNHLSQEMDLNCPPRNALVEAARIARSKIKPLCQCEACSHCALVIPGGFGAARTLSDFATKGSDCTVLPELEKLIEDFYCGKKPIGTICIASALVARVLKGVKVTLGKNSPKEDWPYAEAIDKVKKMGAKVEMKDVKGVTRCKKYNVYSTPAWLNKSASYIEVHDGIGKLITMMKKCMN